MRVASITSDGDWRFGRGRSTYLEGAPAVRQKVVTRMRSIRDDWFLDIDHGADWLDIFGEPNNEDDIRRETERIVTETEGVRQFTGYELIDVTDRNARIRFEFATLYDPEPFSVLETVPAT